MVDRNAIDTGTRIAAGDDGTNYGNVAIALHWLTALLVVLQFSLGQTWGWFPRPTRHLMVVTHMSFGIILTLVIFARVLWRFAFRHHVASLESGFVRIASTTVHYLLYALLGTEAVLGFLSRWEGNEAMSFFGLQIPPPFSGSGQKVAHQLQDIHNWVGWAIIVIAVGHALAALYHYYFLKDRVLGRMLPAAR
ncbi:MAG TPA: cytochrome b [Sphingomicrobium sp.]|nr:cytochrome b [Sphingomicrobium sp.]